MFAPLVLLLLGFNKVATAVPCWQIGLDTVQIGDGGPPGPDAANITQLNPFVSGQGFDIIDIKNCALRFQSPGGRFGAAANVQDFATQLQQQRVTQAVWNDERDWVTATMNNYQNSEGTNIPLWLWRATNAFVYAGLLTGGDITPQSGLDSPETLISICTNASRRCCGIDTDDFPVLPSGMSKVTEVSAERTTVSVIRAMDTGIAGMRGTVDPSQDYAYAPVWAAMLGLLEVFPTRRTLAANPQHWAGFAQYQIPTNGPFFLASKIDGSCVVMDLRNMDHYALESKQDSVYPVCTYNPGKRSAPKMTSAWEA